MYRQRSNIPTSPKLSKPNLSPLRSVFRRLFVKMLSSGGGRSGGDATPTFQSSGRISDPLLPLLNLSALGRKMDTVRGFLSDAVDRRAFVSSDQLRMVSSEITSAVQGIILNGAALLASSHTIAPMPPGFGVSSTVPRGPPAAENSSDRNLAPDKDATAEDDGDDCDIVEIDTAELLAEHVHFCEVCGKGFKRDANLRMHMRAHGNQFKTLEALSKPAVELEGGEAAIGRKVRFSCPFTGCNRNRTHKKFRPLKSAVCVKNHFKRSHCPKTYPCHRCNKKSFSVVADLRSHLKHCGESHWRCSCGTSFSRKDKLFGHIALFEGHMPAIVVEENENRKDKILDKGNGIGGAEPENEGFDADFFKGIVEKLDEIESSDWVPH